VTAVWLALAVVLVFVLPFACLVARRRALQWGGGTVEVSLHLKPSQPGAGWVLGVGRFADDELQWFRVFSLAPWPRRRLSRRDLSICRQRPPTGARGARPARRRRRHGVPRGRPAGRAGDGPLGGDGLPGLARVAPARRDAPR
jgi:hypothetical protein